MPSPYEILGIDKSATADDIKRAYRKLASKHHPDKGGDTAKFQEIQNAYDILSDDTKRKQYDMGGQFGQGTPHGFGSGHFNFNGPFGPFGGTGDPFEDLREFFQRGGMPPRQRRNQDIAISHPLSLFDSLSGKKETIQFRTAQGTLTTLEIDIPAGVHFGYRVRYAGYGDDSIAGIPRGDLLVDIKLVLPHNYWVEHHNTLHTKLNVDVLTAMVGGKQPFTNFDGKQYEIKIPPGTQPATKFKLRDQGMMLNREKRGDLFIMAEINIPAITDEDQVSIIKSLKLDT